ncbi:MAG TPA: response regulator, partial [Geobacteraceae bacterium]|nr:response regulator [Geobacteraceae bacterium]
MDKVTILVVEDETIVAADLAGKLAVLGYEVVGTASTGKEAVKAACRLHPRLVLLDIRLKGAMDGIAAAEEIRRVMDVPMIYLTAHSDAATLERAKLSEPSGFVLKPFDERDLAIAIELALFKHRTDRQMREQNDLLQARSEALQLANEELATANEELRVQGEELAASCQELELAQEALRESHAGLENRVAERTRELAAAIDVLRDENKARQKAENELRVSEESLRRANRLYAVVSATNHAIVHAQESESIYREFCRVAVELGGFRLAWVGLVDRETGLVNVVAASGVTGYLDGIRISVNLEPAGLGPTGRAVREGTYYICNDFLASEVTRPWHEKAHAHGLFASASIAIKCNDGVIGALTLYAGEKEFFDDSQ